MMKKTVCLIVMIFFLTGSMLHIAAQSGIYVPSKGKIFFKGDTATVFSNVQNAGKIGIGKKAVVNFKGKRWQNETGSMITDESDGGEGANGEGGLIRFMGDEIQELDGGYNAVTKSGASFWNLQLNNPFGLQLTGSTTKIRHELQFVKGHLFLHDNILITGNGNPGSISGYGPSRYIVTGNKPGSGFLIRERIAATDGLVVFPIGTRPGAYTPAALRTSAIAGDDYYMNVFDSVRQEVTSGINLQKISVNKTWEAGKLLRPQEDETEIFLQHLVADEGPSFNTNRGLSYISAWTNGQWDTSRPQQLPMSGSLTTGAPLANSGLNSRLLKNSPGSSTYFTKFTGISLARPDSTRVWLNAYRKDWNNVQVYWTTKPEVNNHYFVVQRRLSNEPAFQDMDTVYTSALNGNSTNFLHYSINDPNNYAPNSYYRLKVVNRNSQYFYTNVVVVNGKPGGFQLLLWPNPSTGLFYIGINGAAAVKTIIIWDAVGRKIREVAVNERTIIEMRLYLPGVYMISFISHGGQLLETKKLVIQPY
jgi:hypothetical protein